MDTITNLCSADDIDGVAGNELELTELIRRLEKSSTDFGMEINGEKTKVMTNSTFTSEIKIREQKLRECPQI